MTSRAAARFATPAWIALVLAIAGASLFGVLDNGFVWDDNPFIVKNTSLSGPGALRRIFMAGDAFGTGLQNPYYRPLTTLSFAVDRRLFGENPAGYHATNLLLHLVVCALVFLSALQLTGRRVAAGVAALLFAVHPANVEPVAYISARADLLCAAFTLGAWLLYLRGRAAGSFRDLGFAAFAFALALFSKIIALALLPALVLYEILFVSRGERRLRSLVPFGAIAGGFLLARSLVLERTTWESGVPFTTRLATAGCLLLEYLWNTLLPFKLKIYYHEYLRTVWTDPAVFRAWAIIAACAVAWVLVRRRRPVIAIGVAWFFAALFPVSGIVDLLFPALMADRYLYLPLAGAAFAVAGALPDPGPLQLRRLTTGRLAAIAVGCAALIACVSAFAITSAGRVTAWHDSVALWEAARRGAPQSPYVLNGLGWSYRQINRFDEAKRVLVQAAALAPDFTEPKVNLAAIAFLQGDSSTAALYTEQVLQLNPGNAVALRFLSILFEGSGRLDLAIESLKAAIAADPLNADNRRYLSELESAQRKDL